MQVKNSARQDLSMKTIINTIIETIKFWEEKGMDYKNAGVDIEAGQNFRINWTIWKAAIASF